MNRNEKITYFYKTIGNKLKKQYPTNNKRFEQNIGKLRQVIGMKN